MKSPKIRRCEDAGVCLSNGTASPYKGYTYRNKNANTTRCRLVTELASRGEEVPLMLMDEAEGACTVQDSGVEDNGCPEFIFKAHEIDLLNRCEPLSQVRTPLHTKKRGNIFRVGVSA